MSTIYCWELKAKAGMAHSDCGWRVDVQVKLWDPLISRAIAYLSASDVMIHEEALYQVPDVDDCSVDALRGRLNVH